MPLHVSRTICSSSGGKKKKCTHIHKMCFVKVLLRYARFPSVCEIDTVVWNITPCSFIGDCQCFGETCCSYLQKRSP